LLIRPEFIKGRSDDTLKVVSETVGIHERLMSHLQDEIIPAANTMLLEARASNGEVLQRNDRQSERFCDVCDANNH
jgi:hypothetical protein